MNLQRFDTALRVATVVVGAIGLGFIFVRRPAFTTAGIVLLILSTVVFLVVVRNFLKRRAMHEQETR